MASKLNLDVLLWGVKCLTVDDEKEFLRRLFEEKILKKMKNVQIIVRSIVPSSEASRVVNKTYFGTEEEIRRDLSRDADYRASKTVLSYDVPSYEFVPKIYTAGVPWKMECLLCCEPECKNEHDPKTMSDRDWERLCERDEILHIEDTELKML